MPHLPSARGCPRDRGHPRQVETKMNGAGRTGLGRDGGGQGRRARRRVHPVRGGGGFSGAGPERPVRDRILESATPHYPAHSLAPRRALRRHQPIPSRFTAAGTGRPDYKPQHAPGSKKMRMCTIPSPDLEIIGPSWELIQLFSKICVKTPH